MQQYSNGSFDTQQGQGCTHKVVQICWIGLGGRVQKKYLKQFNFFQTGGGPRGDPKAYISDMLFFDNEISKGSVNGENRQNGFLSCKDGLT